MFSDTFGKAIPEIMSYLLTHTTDSINEKTIGQIIKKILSPIPCRPKLYSGLKLSWRYERKNNTQIAKAVRIVYLIVSICQSCFYNSTDPIVHTQEYDKPDIEKNYLMS